MDRRQFLKGSLLSSGGLALSSRAQGAVLSAENAPGKLHIQYVREGIPSFDIPAYTGHSYADKVPDTLDIAEQARLGIHGMTSIADPDADDEIYRALYLNRNPPVMAHDFNDFVQVAEGIQEALPLVRTATGENLNSPVDRVWMEVFLKSLGPDGLMYVPLKGRPWTYLYIPVGELGVAWRADGSSVSLLDKSITQLSCGSIPGRAVSTMTVYYLRDKNPMWKQAAERMIQRVAELAIEKEDYAYVVGAWEPYAKLGRNAEMPKGLNAIELNGRMIQGFTQYYKVTGYEPALQLARKFTNLVRYQSQYFDSQGRFLMADDERKILEKYFGKIEFGGHGHGHGIGLVCVLEYAMAVNDHETRDFVRASYEWVQKEGPSRFGVSTVVGWFPENFAPNYPVCETDIVADMVALAVKLSVIGASDYWDDVDRWTRNHLTEAQLSGVDWIYRMAEHEPRKPVAENEVAEQAPERNVGAWANSAKGTEWGIAIDHCCTGNTPRALYYVWEHMIEYRDGQLRLNLLANRASRWADVYSYIPYQGRVGIKMKEACTGIKVRAPEWIEALNPQLTCNVNGSARALNWEGRYVSLGTAQRGDIVSVTFPISERTIKERIGAETYTLVVKGNTVVSIDPAGKDGPLYQDRARYRKQDVRWRQVNRFLSDQPIVW